MFKMAIWLPAISVSTAELATLITKLVVISPFYQYSFLNLTLKKQQKDRYQTKSFLAEESDYNPLIFCYLHRISRLKYEKFVKRKTNHSYNFSSQTTTWKQKQLTKKNLS